MSGVCMACVSGDFRLNRPFGEGLESHHGYVLPFSTSGLWVMCCYMTMTEVTAVR